MRILMATTKLYPPQFYGGAEMSTHSMTLMLRDKGHDVAVVAGLSSRGFLRIRNRVASKLRSRTAFPEDTVLGYPVYRGWEPCQAVEEVVERFSPDVVLAQSGEVVAIASKFVSAGVPVCVFLRHTHYDSLGGIPEQSPGLTYIANSRFTADRYKTDFGLNCGVMTPLVIPDLYRTVSDKTRVVYINANPVKGAGLVLELAGLRPDIPFDIVESWTLPDWMTEDLRRTASQLPNVRWLKARSDMREIYSRAKVLLAPSGVGHPEWIEAWGRVATEAQVSGIPVLASNSGGLPESVGPGGIILDTQAPVEEWLSALARLWDEPDEYEAYSEAALQHSLRDEINPKWQIDKVIQYLDGWTSNQKRECTPLVDGSCGLSKLEPSRH